MSKRITFFILMFFLVGLSMWGSASLGIRLYQELTVSQNPNAWLFAVNAYLTPDEQLGWTNCSNCQHYHPELGSARCSIPGFCKQYEFGSSGNRIASGAPELSGAADAVWVLGDSSAFGLGVESEDVFSERLRRSLLSRGLDVVNFSVVGYNSFQIHQRLLRQLERSKEPPSMIIVWGGFNDLEFSRHLFMKYIVPSGLDSWLGERSLKFWLTRVNIKKIVELGRRLEIPVVVNTLPSREESYWLSKYRDWLLTLHDPENGTFVNDVRQRFRSEPLQGLYTDYDSVLELPKVFHPGERGHRIVSEMLREIVDRALPIQASLAPAP
jgi:lysophospholipase L1-like esterase